MDTDAESGLERALVLAAPDNSVVNPCSSVSIRGFIRFNFIPIVDIAARFATVCDLNRSD